MTEKKQSAANKDVIYIDVDDEITGIIDKVRGSEHKIVALVLPKRATVLQSVVNMKLLKRASDEAKKNMVLITSEVGLLPLAGSVGIHVAKTLQSKPEVPDAPDRGDSKPETVAEPDDIQGSDDEDVDNGELDKTKPVGELAGSAALEETIDMDDEDEDMELPDTDNDAGVKKGKDKKKFKIPNFSRFRVLVLLGSVGLVAIVVLGYLAFAVMPKAQVTIKTDSQALTSSTIVTLKTGDAVKLDLKTATVPAKAQQVQKTLNQQVNATGQQNNGQKAGGTVTIKNCTDSSVTIPAGSGVSSTSLTFITQSALTLAAGNFTSGGVCKSSGSHIGTVSVVAQQPGTKYNIDAGAAFTVAGYASGVTGSGTAMTGGTDDITKVVSQADIDSATQKLGQQDATGIKQELQTDLTNVSFYPVPETFSAGAPDVKTSAKAGDKADTVTVTQTITYTMLGAKQADLQQIIGDDIAKKIDTKKQSILDYGLSGAVFGIQSQPEGGAVVTMQTTVVAGPDLKVEDIKKQIAGKKAGDAKELIKQNPGVTDVDVHYSPFWVGAIPKKTTKITVTVEKPQVTKSTDNASDASTNP